MFSHCVFCSANAVSSRDGLDTETGTESLLSHRRERERERARRRARETEREYHLVFTHTLTKKHTRTTEPWQVQLTHPFLSSTHFPSPANSYISLPVTQLSPSLSHTHLHTHTKCGLHLQMWRKARGLRWKWGERRRRFRYEASELWIHQRRCEEVHCVSSFLEFPGLLNNCSSSVSCLRLRFMVRGYFHSPGPWLHPSRRSHGKHQKTVLWSCFFLFFFKTGGGKSIKLLYFSESVDSYTVKVGSHQHQGIGLTPLRQ